MSDAHPAMAAIHDEVDRLIREQARRLEDQLVWCMREQDYDMLDRLTVVRSFSLDAPLADSAGWPASIWKPT